MSDYFARRRGRDRKGKEDRAFIQEMLHPVIKYLTHGSVVAAHHALHPVNRADHVAFIYHVASAHADE